jgi:RimJ/RimL family protein N-acetyltransferase
VKLVNRQTLLRTIQHSDLEQIRTWRNLESVNRYLVNRHHISEQQQETWFNNLDYSTSIYFMMEESSSAPGVIYAHNIDTAAKSFEGSIFIGDMRNVSSQLPVKASLMLTMFFFEHLHYEYALSKVHHANKPALQLDRRLGFKDLGQEGEFIIGQCAKPDFNFRTARLRKSLLNSQGVEIIFEKGDERFHFCTQIWAQHAKD